MRCNHCGRCCTSEGIQINVTIGDIWRIANYLNIPIARLFPEKISLNSFKDPRTKETELDLGLNIPCRFRKDNRCSIYPARPLNCRLFPYWVIAAIDEKDLSTVLKGHKCSYSIKDKERYKAYSKQLGNILLEEDKLFNIKGRKLDKETILEMEKIMMKNLDQLASNKENIEKAEKLLRS
ncbi:hypothetical protein GF336_00120 [Candidatus Woesearchaeota archaeon]|nr:hypothetical protein [Candidatus Woesearchaeota archaeon]